MVTWPLVKYVIKAGIRDKLFISLILLIVVGVSISFFMGSAAIIEKKDFASTFSAGGLRFLGAAGLILFVCFYIRRAFETKDVEFLLSRPISRPSFMISHALALSLLAVSVGVMILLPMMIVQWGTFDAGYLLWGVSIIVELILMANVALFFSMVLSSAVASALATFGFYVLARLMGVLLGIIDSGSGIPFVGRVIDYIMQAISLIIPRLDLMGQTSWLVYGVEDGGVGFGFVVMQGVVFLVLVSAASIVDLVRRQF